MSRILPLPPDAISQIHSSKNITSLHDVALALLENSLDADATKVQVAVDFRRGSCDVEDDGHGIPAAEFDEQGGLGKMHHTSKRQPNTDRTHHLHGYNGTYLASLASLSLLQIECRSVASSQRCRLTMHQGKVIERRTAKEVENLDRAVSRGTQVTVRDLFGNMPVRVKQRALGRDHGNDDERAWQQLKAGITALLLAWPRPCSVRLVDSTRTDRKVHLAGAHPLLGSALTTSGLRRLDRGGPAKFGALESLPIVFQAGLAHPESRAHWVPVSASAVDITVKGLICLDPAPTKQCQFVSVGVQPCMNFSGSSDMYDAINKVFFNSSFGAAEDDSDIDEEEQDCRKRDRRFKGDGYTQRQLHSRKGIDRWPMFILSVNFRNSTSSRGKAEDLSDPTLKGIIGVLEATVTQWLKAHHFRPRKRRARPHNGDQQRPSLASGVATRSRMNSERPSSPHPSTTSELKRAITTDSNATSKRRKVIDLVERPQSVDRTSYGGGQATESPFSMWSLIKSGKESNHGKNAELPRATTAPESVSRSGARVERAVRSHGFTLPPIEAGALNAARHTHADLSPIAPNRSGTLSTREPAAVSNDDFGSVDDNQILVAAREVESPLSGAADGKDSDGSDADDVVDWIDPRTRQKYQVSSRTGVVLPTRPKLPTVPRSNEQADSSGSRQTAAINTALSSTGNFSSLAKRTATAPIDKGQSTRTEARWLPGFLQQWDNPVFARQDEERIPSVLPNDPELQAAEAGKHCCAHSEHPQDMGRFTDISTARLTKTALKGATAIKQVDAKFILCKIPNAAERETLVLIDQHAASERLILEGLLAELCTPAEDPATSSVKTTTLEKPVHFQISAQEAGLFQQHITAFARWGIVLKASQRDDDLPASQDVRSERRRQHFLTVTHLPPGIAERCSLVPRILIEMLRSEVWSMADRKMHQPLIPPATTGDDKRHTWLQRIGSCPKGVLEMLNSRACRSAIMFNDVLSVRECEELVSKLSECAFPFMCAHGRVSMVPLAHLSRELFSGLDSLARSAGGVGEDYKVAFARWVSNGG